jgi:hypothetical protein
VFECLIACCRGCFACSRPDRFRFAFRRRLSPPWLSHGAAGVGPRPPRTSPPQRPWRDARPPLPLRRGRLRGLLPGAGEGLHHPLLRPLERAPGAALPPPAARAVPSVLRGRCAFPRPRHAHRRPRPARAAGGASARRAPRAPARALAYAPCPRRRGGHRGPPRPSLVSLRPNCGATLVVAGDRVPQRPAAA